MFGLAEMVTIRPADHSDVHPIATIFVESWRSTYAGMLPDRMLVEMSADRQEGFWRKTMDRRGGLNIVTVAENDDGEVVGFVNAGRSRSWPLTYAGEIYTLYLLGDYQGIGLGRRLLTDTLTRMDEVGIRNAIVWVLAENPSRYFYSRMGARMVGERHEQRWGIALREIAYAWDDIKSVLAPGGPLAVRE